MSGAAGGCLPALPLPRLRRALSIPPDAHRRVAPRARRYVPQSPRAREGFEQGQTDLVKEMFHEMGASPDAGLRDANHTYIFCVHVHVTLRCGLCA